jgi:AraC-like DNA-binding protein
VPRSKRAAGAGRWASLHAENGISAAVVGAVIDALLGLGIDPRDVQAMPSTERLVPGALADRWLDVASARLHDDVLGITLAGFIPIGGLGMLDYALCTSSTLRDALGRVARHYGIATQRVTLRLEETPPRATLLFERRPGLSHSRHWIEFSFAIIAQRMRQTMGRTIAFEEVTFRHEPPAGTLAYDAYFGTRVLFSRPEDRLGFAHPLLDVPLRTASSALAELLDARMRELEPAEERDLYVDRVRQALVALIEERDVGLEAVAKRLCVSRRTLQRELRRRGTSHKDVLDEVRRERALALLGESVTVADIASRLAYSEPSAFFRAFRRWTGTSPRAAVNKREP